MVIHLKNLTQSQWLQKWVYNTVISLDNLKISPIICSSCIVQQFRKKKKTPIFISHGSPNRSNSWSTSITIELQYASQPRLFKLWSKEHSSFEYFLVTTTILHTIKFHYKSQSQQNKSLHFYPPSHNWQITSDQTCHA